MLIEMIMFSDLSDSEKFRRSLDIFYCRKIPADINAALEQMLWFYHCGKQSTGKSRGQAARRRNKRCYCFDQDAPMIYAAFRTQYGINLSHTGNEDLHWWEFWAMFENLDENLKISKVMYWRSADLSKLPKKEAGRIRKLKKVYALKEPKRNPVDSQVRLAKRNADMLAYVTRRMENTQEGGEKKYGET